MVSISRRDFLDGVSLTIAAGLTPLGQIAAAAPYPPALTGLRGHHPGSFEIAHELVREGKAYSVTTLPIEEHYDLVVVGGGISGLSAAFFYRRKSGSPRILILENHDDFGGHAKRNEFRLGGRLIVGYGGAESLQSPKGLYSNVAKSLLQNLHVDIARFETAFDRELYSSLRLSHGIFFAREAFGRDVLVTGDSTASIGDDVRAKHRKAKSIRELIAGFPISPKSKDELIRLYHQTQDPLSGKTSAEKISILKKVSYRDYLIKYCGCSVEVVNCFQGRTLDFFAVGCDSVPAFDLMEARYPGFAGLKLPPPGANAEFDEPYIYHFPDGNASIARLLVRALVPGVAPGPNMEDVILARFDNDLLDRAENRVRIRLNSTCVQVRNQGKTVDIGYVRDGKLHRVTAKHVVLACFNMVIPHIMPELSEPQRDALRQNVKAPMLYNNVLIRDWKAWANLGVHDIAAPMSFHSRVKLDYPVSLGTYRHSRRPAEPMCLHLCHVAGAPNQGFDARAQFRIGRQTILEMSFDQIENRIRDELDRMLGPGGFSSERDIAAITVNRWAHGYSYTPNSLFDNEDYLATIARAREPIGHVAIANSDSEWSAYTHSAIDAAYRAVHEVLSS
jgi:spermidine dehydrogenase